MKIKRITEYGPTKVGDRDRKTTFTIENTDVLLLELDFVELKVKADLRDALATNICAAMTKIAEYAQQEGADVTKKALVDALDTAMNTAMEELPIIHLSDDWERIG